MELAPHSNATIDRIARSATFAIVSRSAMIFTTVIAFPILGWMIQRGVSAVDRLTENSEKTTQTIMLIEQRMQDIRDVQRDHEMRLRSAEKQRK